MSRGVGLYLLGLASVLVGAVTAFVSSRNHELGAELSRQVHACEDLRVRIDERRERVLERVDALHREFLRDELGQSDEGPEVEQ